jgi:hypothetical protein
MERKEYQYNPTFSKETNDNLKVFHEIREDCKLILNAQKHIEWVTGNKSPEPTDEMMNNYNEYLKGYINEENKGILRTLLVIGKPYKHNPIVKDTLEILANKLREDSPTGKI